MKHWIQHLANNSPFFTLSFAGVLLLSSCGFVSTSTPLGLPIKISATRFNGAWIQEPDKINNPEPPEKEKGDEPESNLGVVIIVKVTNTQKGEIKILTVDLDTLETESLLFSIRQIGTVTIGNLFDQDSKQWVSMLIEQIEEGKIAFRLFNADGVRSILNINNPPLEQPLKKSKNPIFLNTNDDLLLSKTQQKQFEAWLQKLPTNKKQREKIIEKITSQQKERTIFTRKIRNNQISE